MKRILACAAALLILLPVMALAETEMLFQYKTSIKPIAGTGYFTMASKEDNTLGLFRTNGQQILPYGYAAVDYLGDDYFSACKDMNALNGKALVRSDGTQAGEMKYAGFTVFNRYWVAAYTVQEEQADKGDVTINKVAYLYDQVDLYYFGNGTAELAASFTYDEYANAAVHGDYIAIQDREGKVSVYDSAFQPVAVELKAFNSPMFAVKDYQIQSLLTGEILADGYSEVKETVLADRTLIQATHLYWDGTKLVDLLDMDGSPVMTGDYQIVTLTDRYAVVTDMDKNQGLFSLDEQKLIVPCVYTSIVAVKTDVDPYVHNGYVCVEKDGKYGFVSAATGEETVAPKYSKSVVTLIGCVLAYNNADGSMMLVAGDGTVTTVEDAMAVATRGDGYLVAAKRNGFVGLVDWHGNEILPFIHNKDIVVTDDSRAIIRTSTGLQIDALAR